MNNDNLAPSVRAALAAEALPGIRVENPTGEAAAVASRKFGCNRDYVYRAAQLMERAPDLFEEVKVGRMTLREAARALEEKCRQPVKKKPSGHRNETVMAVVEPAQRLQEHNGQLTMTVNLCSWRNELASAMADQRKFEKALKRGLLIRMETND